MFSLDKFYYILHDQLISKIRNARSFFFTPFGTYDNIVMLVDKNNCDAHYIPSNFQSARGTRSHFFCFFYDQEPLYSETPPGIDSINIGYEHSPRLINIFANSEHSEIKRSILRTKNVYGWYYFFHGFAALDWYRDFQYLTPKPFNRSDKVFICYNHLISKYRSYRLHLGSNLISQDLVKHGVVSLPLADDNATWQEELEDSNSLLSTKAKVKIYQTMRSVSTPLVADVKTPNGNLSAEVELDQLTGALWHVVPETVYYFNKLHLTEKVFKPIVAQRPFILVAAPGNLAYLKSYGFKTFDRWIDESYDQEQDHYLRIEKITAEIDKLCKLTPAELEAMYTDMQEVLEYNFNHFYGEFKRLIVNELVDNFTGVLGQYNNGRQPNNHSKHHQRYELPEGHAERVKQLLLK